MNLTTAFTAVILLFLLLLIGRLARQYIKPLQWILLPASVVAGMFGLILGPEILGNMTNRNVLPDGVHSIWREMPGLLISVVFATLFMGKKIPSPRKIWEMAAPQATFGQTLAWGQYVIGLLLAILILSPLFDMSPMAGALIEIGFEGGHGTAAGLTSTFEELGFDEGRDLALGLATIGVVMAVILGSALVKFEKSRNKLDNPDETNGDKVEKSPSEKNEQNNDQSSIINSSKEHSILEPLSLQLGFISLAIALGWFIQQGFILLENATWGGADGVNIFQHIPLFPLAMIGGVLMQIIIDAIGASRYVSASLMNRISGLALDLTIAAAIATLSLRILADNWQVLLILASAGIIWNLVGFLILAPRIIHRNYFERGIGDFGQSMGMTVTGLLLMRMADPSNRSQAIESFGYKQLLFEPFVGGGLVTAMSLPLIYELGPFMMLAITGSVFCSWLIFAWFKFIRHYKPITKDKT